MKESQIRPARSVGRCAGSATAMTVADFLARFPEVPARRRAIVPVVVDASDPQVATSTRNAAAGVVLRRNAPALDFRVRTWYNPDLVSAIFIVPGLIGALLMQTTITAMAISVVREREKGTLEALIVSPIRRVGRRWRR